MFAISPIPNVFSHWQANLLVLKFFGYFKPDERVYPQKTWLQLLKNKGVIPCELAIIRSGRFIYRGQ